MAHLWRIAPFNIGDRRCLFPPAPGAERGGLAPVGVLVPTLITAAYTARSLTLVAFMLVLVLLTAIVLATQRAPTHVVHVALLLMLLVLAPFTAVMTAVAVIGDFPVPCNGVLPRRLPYGPDHRRVLPP